MNRSNKLEEIFKKIAEFEKETPYNYCDRWCKYRDMILGILKGLSDLE